MEEKNDRPQPSIVAVTQKSLVKIAWDQPMKLSRDSIELSAAKFAMDYENFNSYLSQTKSRRLNSEESYDANETEESR